MFLFDCFFVFFLFGRGGGSEKGSCNASYDLALRDWLRTLSLELCTRDYSGLLLLFG